MKTIITFIMLLFALLPAQAIIRIDANPINVAFDLSQETDADEIVSTLKYYGYLPQSPQDGYEVFRNEKGAVIKFSFKDATEAQPYPYVEVKSNRGSTDTTLALEGLQFKKTGHSHVRNVGHHAKTETHCTNSHQGYLMFHRTRLPRE